MQLKPKASRLRTKLIAASCTLLSATAARSQTTMSDESSAFSGASDWVADSALAYYHENNGRVQAIEPVVHARKDFGDDNVLGLNFTFDSLSGSTPNGALPSRAPQTFASPSGTSLNPTPQTYTTASGQVTTASAPIYTIAPGDLPMDPNYHDQRIAVAGTWQTPLTRLLHLSYGGGLSYERDFISASINGEIARDFNQKNTTLSLALNDELDAVRPIGGAPAAGSDYALFEKNGDHGKNGVGLVLGATQVMNRHWLAQLNLSIDRFTGYLNDPYKIISVLDAQGNTTGYLYEKRPDSRTRKSLYLENHIGTERLTTTLTMRYMADNWHVHSETAELRLRWRNPDQDRYLEPTIRWYKQSAADFFTPWVSNSGTQLLGYGSADSRLNAFHAVTYGLKYAADAPAASDGTRDEFSVRVEYYQQIVDNRFAVPANLAGLDLYPGLKAILVQVGWRFGF